MNEQTASDKKTARTAGVLYLLLAIISPFGLIYVPGRVFVPGDAAATAENVLSNEFLFRAGVASHMVSQVLFILMVLLLYELLRRVHRYWGRAMVALVAISLPLALLSDILNLSGLMVLKGDWFDSFEPGQANEIAGMFFKTASNVIQVTQLDWGLWLFPFGLLVYRSGFIPRILGILLTLNGIGYVMLSFTFVLFPEAGSLVLKIAMPLLFIGEFPTILWLLTKGVSAPTL